MDVLQVKMEMFVTSSKSVVLKFFKMFLCICRCWHWCRLSGIVSAGLQVISIHKEKESEYSQGKVIQAKRWLLVTREVIILWKWRNGKAFYSRGAPKSNR